MLEGVRFVGKWAHIQSCCFEITVESYRICIMRMHRDNIIENGKKLSESQQKKWKVPVAGIVSKNRAASRYGSNENEKWQAINFEEIPLSITPCFLPSFISYLLDSIFFLIITPNNCSNLLLFFISSNVQRCSMLRCWRVHFNFMRLTDDRSMELTIMCCGFVWWHWLLAIVGATHLLNCN